MPHCHTPHHRPNAHPCRQANGVPAAGQKNHPFRCLRPFPIDQLGVLGGTPDSNCVPTVPNHTSGADCPECAFDRSRGNIRIHAFGSDQPPLWLARMLPPVVAPDFVSKFDPFFIDYSRVLLRGGGVVWKEAFAPVAAPAGCPSQRQEKRSTERLRRQTEKRCRKVRRRGAHRSHVRPVDPLTAFRQFSRNPGNRGNMGVAY